MQYYFVNGQLDFSKHTAVTDFKNFWIANDTVYTDEVRMLVGECQWKEDFTPPSEPY